jgi:transposase
MSAQKKIAETDAIFQYVHHINRIADETAGVIRLSIDTKANVNVGPFARGGYNRCGVQAADHDFAPDIILKPFGINFPALDENYFYFTDSKVTADFMVDALEDLWPAIKLRFDPHTIVINLDNGPENNSRRSQFMKRLVEFAQSKSINISLAYYPPYHSKYNPIERVWGVLEKHWNGELLYSVEKVLGLSRTMNWNGESPIVKMVKGVYEKGVKLTKKAMEELETLLVRLPGIEKWAVDIICYEDR